MRLLALPLTLYIAVGLLDVAQAFRWVGELQPGDSLSVCEGLNASFPWDIKVDEAKELRGDFRWRRQKKYLSAKEKSKPKIKDDLVIFENSPRFIYSASSTKPLSLIIKDTNVNDTGKYTMNVSITEMTSVTGRSKNHLSTVSLLVKASPRTKEGVLLIKERELAEKVNGRWRIVLECGRFTYLGHPPVKAVFTTPEGTSESSGYANGIFYLVLQEPVMTGIYTCKVAPTEVAVDCVDRNNQQLISNRHKVTEERTKIKFLEGKTREMAEMDKRLMKTDLTMGNTSKSIGKRVAELEKKVEKITSRPADCKEEFALSQDPKKHVAEIRIGKKTVKVLCDGEWTIIDRRVDGTENFARGWTEYEEGFGAAAGEYWLGLKNIHQMTMKSGKQYILKVELEDFEGTRRYAIYQTFSVEAAAKKYQLHVAGYKGDLGSVDTKGLSDHNNAFFSTKDKDNDKHPKQNCAETWGQGGWWFVSCFSTNLNGQYSRTSTDFKGVVWNGFRSSQSLKTAVMKIKPKK